MVLTVGPYCDACVSGYYADLLTTIASNFCIACISNCGTCVDSSTCNTCKIGYVYDAINSKCICDNLNQYFLNTNNNQC